MVDLDDKLAEKVALSCNILDMGGHGNFTQGHVTAREPGQTHLHMKPRGLGLDEVTTRDIIVIDFEGNKLAGLGERHSEYPLHAEIYKMYPDINCVIHSHPFYSIIVSSTGNPIKVVCNEGVLFADVPVFTETTLLVRTPEAGQAVARCLNGHRALLMYNHGVVVTGPSVEEATVSALLLERAAKFQVMADQVDSVSWSSMEEILRKREQGVYYPKNMKEIWGYCVRKLRK
jgi:L-fuculose-phosphate aldolase